MIKNRADLGKPIDFDELNTSNSDDDFDNAKRHDVDAKQEESNLRKKRLQPPKGLASLVYNIEAANSHPALALDYLHDLKRDVDEIIEKIHMIENSFAPNLTDEDIEDKIETFMQNSLLIIDNHQEL